MREYRQCICMCIHIRALTWAHLNKLFSVNSMPQPTCYNSLDRFITFCQMTSAGAISGVCGNQSPLGDPHYVIGSLCLQAFDTDKRMVAAVAGGPRYAGSVRSIILSAMMQSECSRPQLIMMPILDTGHFRGKRGRGAFSRCSLCHRGVYDLIYLFQSEKVQRSKRCRL